VDDCRCYRNLSRVYVEHLGMSNEDSSVQRRTHAGYLPIGHSRNAALGPLMMKLQSNERRNSKRGMETTLIIRGTKISDKQKLQHRRYEATSVTSKTHNGIDEAEVRTQVSDRGGARTRSQHLYGKKKHPSQGTLGVSTMIIVLYPPVMTSSVLTTRIRPRGWSIYRLASCLRFSARRWLGVGTR
jgi:hypothetical protein